MNNQKHDSLVNDIMLEIGNLDVAQYILQEVKDFMKYVNHYKLANVYENMEDFKDYLKRLDHQNSIQISQLELKNEVVEDSITSDVAYYLSNNGLDILGKGRTNLISKTDYNLNNVMQAMKGYIILTVDEFCNATPTRLSINKMIWQKEYSLA